MTAYHRRKKGNGERQYTGIDVITAEQETGEHKKTHGIKVIYFIMAQVRQGGNKIYCCKDEYIRNHNPLCLLYGNTISHNR